MPCSLVVKMLNPVVSCQKFERSISGMETAHEDVGMIEKAFLILTKLILTPEMWSFQRSSVFSDHEELDFFLFEFRNSLAI